MLDTLLHTAFWVLGLAITAYACIDFVKDNERGAAFWPLIPGGWYGNILRPGLVLKLPFAKIYTYSIMPRKDKKKLDTFITEPKTGFMVKSDMLIVSMFDKYATKLDDFIKFHQVQEDLEENVWEYVKNFVDGKIRHEDEPATNSVTTDKIISEAITEANDFIKEYSGAGRLAFKDNWLKIDIDDAAREAVEGVRIQDKVNERRKSAQDQVNILIDETRGADKEMTRKEAAITVLNVMDKPSNMSDQTFNIPGLPEAVGGILRKIISEE